MHLSYNFDNDQRLNVQIIGNKIYRYYNYLTLISWWNIEMTDSYVIHKNLWYFTS